MRLLAWFDRLPCTLFGHWHPVKVCEGGRVFMRCLVCDYESPGIEAPVSPAPPSRVTRKRLPKPKPNVTPLRRRA